MSTGKGNVDFVFLKKLFYSNCLFFILKKSFVSFILCGVTIAIGQDSNKCCKLILSYRRAKSKYTISRDFLKFSSSRHPHKEAIDFFTDMIRNNEITFSDKYLSFIFSKLFEKNDLDKKFIDYVESEIQCFKQYSEGYAIFFVSNIEIEFNVLNDVQCTFSLIDDDFNEEFFSYNISNQMTKEQIIESFMFGLKYCLSAKNTIDYLKNSICMRDEKWVKSYGM